MLDEERLEDKRISKTSAVAAMAPYEIPMRIGPSDFVGFLHNDKVCYISMKGKYFGDVPLEVDVKLKVVDAYNSAGVMIDAIRATKIAIDRGVSGLLDSVSVIASNTHRYRCPILKQRKTLWNLLKEREKDDPGFDMI